MADATPTEEELLLEWMAATPTLGKRDRQTLLLKELMAVHTMRSMGLGIVDQNDLASPHMNDAALADQEQKLCVALRRTVSEVLDVAAARQIAETISTSTDLDTLYGALDPHCTMSVRVTGDGVSRPQQHLRGADDIINELSEFQESILLLRVDASSSLRQPHHSKSSWSEASSNSSSSRAIAVRGVSSVKSWIAQCAVEVEVGTQLTYYTDSARTDALFDVRSSVFFSADGLKVERLSRELLPRGGHHLDDLLRVLHFGSFHV